MKIHRSLSLGVALVIPQLWGAQPQLPTAVFAKVEGVLDFCDNAAPNEAEKYEKLRKQLAKGASETDLSEMRKTQEYKDAYEQAKLELAKMPGDKAIKACSASLEDSK